MDNQINKVMDAADNAIRFPHSAMKIAELSPKPDVTNKELVAAIETDPAFSVRLLKRVNSAAYSSGSPIADLSDAVTRLGRREITELAMIQATASAFDKMESKLMQTTTFWSHSRTVALLARQIAQKNSEARDLAFIAGLLHDIGLLIMFHELPDTMIDVLELSLEDDDISLVEAELDICGFNHAELGSELAHRWNLPESLIMSIKYHHNPEEAPEYQATVASVALANEIESDPEMITSSCTKIFKHTENIIDISDLDINKAVADSQEKAALMDAI